MKSRELRLLIVFVFVFSIIGASYAVTKISFQNTSNINTGLNIFITQPTQTTQICPTDGNPAYKNTNIQPLFWNLTAGDPGDFYYFCIDNQGSVPDQISITITQTSPVSGGTIGLGPCPNTTGTQMDYVITVPSTALQSHTATATPVNINVCAGGGSGAPLGPGPSFTISVQ